MMIGLVEDYLCVTEVEAPDSIQHRIIRDVASAVGRVPLCTRYHSSGNAR